MTFQKCWVFLVCTQKHLKMGPEVENAEFPELLSDIALGGEPLDTPGRMLL